MEQSSSFKGLLKISGPKTRNLSPPLDELQRLFARRSNYAPEKKSPKLKYTACGKAPEEPKKYVACWEPPQIPDSIQFGVCWDCEGKWRQPKLKAKVATQHMRNLDHLKLNFESCKSIYTKFDYKLEQCVQQQILILDAAFEELRQQLATEKDVQKVLVKEMRYQATRYRILVHSGVCYKPYPECVSKPAETRALHKFQKCLEQLNMSNIKLADAILHIKANRAELKLRLDKLDLTVESPFILGKGIKAPPLADVLDLLNDLYEYFYGVISKMKRWSQLIDPGDEYSLSDYLTLITGEHDFPSFMQMGTEHCTCKRNESKKPLEPYTPCWCQGDEIYMNKPQAWPRYRCDAATMAKLSTSSTSQPTEEAVEAEGEL